MDAITLVSRVPKTSLLCIVAVAKPEDFCRQLQEDVSRAHPTVLPVIILPSSAHPAKRDPSWTRPPKNAFPNALRVSLAMEQESVRHVMRPALPAKLPALTALLVLTHHCLLKMVHVWHHVPSENT